ncbi:MAG: hypothetical protein WC880_00700 [Candidatus Paceibacterota bacterium]
MNPRNTLLIATVTLTLLLVIGAGVMYTLFFAPKKTVSSPSDYFSSLLPFSNSKESSATLSSDQDTQNDIMKTSGTIPLRTLSGVIEVRDFTKDIDVATTSEGDAFLIAFPKEFEFSDTDLQYEISYVPDEQRIYLSIFKEPIGDIRRRASDDLMQRLRVSLHELCTFDTLVVAPRWVNQYYADKNLGFPGCPGAVKFQGDLTF